MKVIPAGNEASAEEVDEDSISDSEEGDDDSDYDDEDDEEDSDEEDEDEEVGSREEFDEDMERKFKNYLRTPEGIAAILVNLFSQHYGLVQLEAIIVVFVIDLE